ncbi:MAG: ABC transporter permease [Candidatus Methanofastidiosia archaeon]|jgi:putative ABC transport system permease protein
MRFNDLIHIVLRNLNRIRIRTILTTLGVIIGVAAIVTLLSVAFGIQENITGQLEGIGDAEQITVRQSRVGPGMIRGGGTAAKSEVTVLDDTALTEIEQVEGVQAVIPTISVNGTIEVGRYTTNSSITGIATEKIEYLEIEMDTGRSFQRNDRNVIIVGYNVDDEFREKETQKLVEDLNIAGKKADIIVQRADEGETESESFRVKIIGIIKEQGTEEDYTVYIPLELAVEIKEWTRFNSNIIEEEGYDSLIVKAHNAEAVLDITDTITELGYQAFSSRQMVESMNQVFVILEIALLGIGAIALIVAALGIINTMLMSIMERTREIGIMKAIGASNTDVTKIFLMEALAIGVLGGLGGVVLGFIASYIIDVFAGTYFLEEGTTQSLVVMPVWLIGFAIGVAMVIGLVSGVYPAGKAAELSPVDALRHQ